MVLLWLPQPDVEHLQLTSVLDWLASIQPFNRQWQQLH
jgi:hypothetical protein